MYMYDHTFNLNLQITRLDIRPHRVGCQPGDCIWSLQSSSGVCVGMFGLTYSLNFYHPRGELRGEWNAVQTIRLDPPLSTIRIKYLCSFIGLRHINGHNDVMSAKTFFKCLLYRWPSQEFDICMVTPGLCKDILCYAWPYSFRCLQITREHIRP